MSNRSISTFTLPRGVPRTTVKRWMVPVRWPKRRSSTVSTRAAGAWARSSFGLPGMEVARVITATVMGTPTPPTPCPYPQQPREGESHGTWKSAPRHWPQLTAQEPQGRKTLSCCESSLQHFQHFYVGDIFVTAKLLHVLETFTCRVFLMQA